MIQRLNVGPPVCNLRRDKTGIGPEQHKVVGGAEPRMREQGQRPATVPTLEPGLQKEHFLQWQRKPLRHRNPANDALHDLVHRI